MPSDPTYLQMYRVVVLGEPAEAPNSSHPPDVDFPVPLQTCRFCHDHLQKIILGANQSRNPLRFVSGKRPTLPSTTVQHDVLRKLRDLIVECWHSIGTYRLSALRLRKSLNALEAKLKNP